MKRRFVAAGVALASLASVSLATVEPAAAWCRWGCGWGPGAVVGGVLAGAAIGAAVAPRPYYYPYYGYRAYGGCWRRDYYGRPYRVC